MSFSQILAQENSINALRRSVVEDQVGHAYLFVGPEGIGKRTTALAYAKALNCMDNEARQRGDFCDTCRSCRMINLGQHPDVRLLTPETTGGKTVIPIDAIRTRIGESPTHPLPLREDAQRKPLEGRYKVYILDPANRPGFQEDAGNALLLTLEEPPPYVVIILISSRPSAVLPTLVSRCRPVRFHLAPHEAVVNALAQTGSISTAEATAIAGMAAGRIGWALSVAANPQALQTRRTLFEEIDRLLPAGRPAALCLAETVRQLAASSDILPQEDEDDAKAKTSADRAVRRNVPQLLDMIASWWRDLLVSSLGEGSMYINGDFAEVIDRHVGCLSQDALRDGLETIMQTKRLVERNANIDLALERMWMAILP
ncbi:MAG TPA: DNA polymerase III subunit delta' [Armatimonadota bacterium]|nr:DNA polymerase III subunit delta' [Armatimonadota bacterium]